MPAAYIGLGSNLGDRETYLQAALAALAALQGTRVVRVSSFVETNPVDSPAGSGLFLNAVARLETSLAPRELLRELLRIEAEQGRNRHGQQRNAPRTLDLDILLYADAVIDTDELKVPHPRMTERRFVLWPLLQIEPKARDPRTGEPLANALARLAPEETP